MFGLREPLWNICRVRVPSFPLDRPLVTTVNLALCNSDRSRIFLKGSAPTPKVGVLTFFVAGNSMKMKEYTKLKHFENHRFKNKLKTYKRKMWEFTYVSIMALPSQKSSIPHWLLAAPSLTNSILFSNVLLIGPLWLIIYIGGSKGCWDTCPFSVHFLCVI